MIYTGIYKIILDGYRSAVGKPEITGADAEIVSRLSFKELTDHRLIGGRNAIELIQEEWGEKRISIIPAQEFYVINGVPTRIQFFIHNDNGIEHKYTLIKEFGIGNNSNTLYLKDGIGYKQVLLESIPETEDLQELEDTFMTTYSVAWREYDSIFESVRSLEAAIQRKMIAVDNDIIKFVNTKYLAKGIKNVVTKREGLLVNKLDDDDIIIGEIDASIDIIERTNEKTREAWDVIRDQVRFISAIVKMWPEDFGLQVTGSNIWVDAQAIRNAKFVNIIEDFREDYEALIKELWLSVNFTWKSILTENESSIQGLES